MTLICQVTHISTSLKSNIASFISPIFMHVGMPVAVSMVIMFTHGPAIFSSLFAFWFCLNSLSVSTGLVLICRLCLFYIDVFSIGCIVVSVIALPHLSQI